ncbi:hypothetical protein Tco_1368935 [Tanacetum coccineum]
MPPRKRARFAAPSHRFEIGESSAAAAARQPMSTLARERPEMTDCLPSRVSSLESRGPEGKWIRKFSDNTLAKLPMLKLENMSMWKLKSSILSTRLCILEVIENGNSWVPIPVTTPESGPSTALKMTVPSNTEKRFCKRKIVKARTRFGGNEATKRTQKALLKQQYENFNASSSESLDSIFNRLQKLNGAGFDWSDMAEYKFKQTCSHAFADEIAKFEKSSKDLDDLSASHVTDKSKKGFSYNAVPSPHPLILNRPTPLDLSYSGLEEFKQHEMGVNMKEVEPIPKVENELLLPTLLRQRSFKPEKQIKGQLEVTPTKDIQNQSAVRKSSDDVSTVWTKKVLASEEVQQYSTAE